MNDFIRKVNPRTNSTDMDKIKHGIYHSSKIYIYIHSVSWGSSYLVPTMALIGPCSHRFPLRELSAFRRRFPRDGCFPPSLDIYGGVFYWVDPLSHSVKPVFASLTAPTPRKHHGYWYESLLGSAAVSSCRQVNEQEYYITWDNFQWIQVGILLSLSLSGHHSLTSKYPKIHC
jgi:hypothetical protein